MQTLCINTGGNWMGCPMEVPLNTCLQTRCSCIEGKIWDISKGCNTLAPNKVEQCYTQISVSKGNPASQFCICMGGTTSIEDTAQGQRGLCKIGLTTYDEWTYFKQMNPYDNKFSQTIVGYDNWKSYCESNQKSVYC